MCGNVPIFSVLEQNLRLASGQTWLKHVPDDHEISLDDDSMIGSFINRHNPHYKMHKKLESTQPEVSIVTTGHSGQQTSTELSRTSWVKTIHIIWL